jgi:hypothetical protein
MEAASGATLWVGVVLQDEYIFFMISKFILQSVVIHLAEWSVRLQWLGERHLVELSVNNR